MKRIRPKRHLDKSGQQASPVLEDKDSLIPSKESIERSGHSEEGQIEHNSKGIEVYVSHQDTFSGQIPHPKHLAAYEEILPGFAERTLSMAEKSQEGFLDDVKAERHIETISLCFGFASFIILIVCSMTALFLGYGIGAAALFLTTVVFGVIRLFVERRDRKG